MTCNHFFYAASGVAQSKRVLFRYLAEASVQNFFSQKKQPCGVGCPLFFSNRLVHFQMIFRGKISTERHFYTLGGKKIFLGEQKPRMCCISSNTASRVTIFVPLVSYLFTIHYLTLNCLVLELLAKTL